MRFLGTASSGTAPVLAERKDAAWTQTTAPTQERSLTTHPDCREHFSRAHTPPTL